MTVYPFLAAAAGGWLYVRARHRQWKATRAARMQRRGHERASSPALSARLLQAWRWTAPRAFPWAFRWRPARRPGRGVPLARPGVLASWVQVRLSQHLLITGVTGSGKSCVLIVDGVYGQLYSAGRHFAVPGEKKILFAGDERMPWLLGGQLAATLPDVTVVDLPEPRGSALAPRRKVRR
ncbi:hypothetical protein [Streptomyces sp. NPDC002588]|uniref:hypothetical protein n=1 Tax=Streptomyces sp. NPDC002588 TaxID=3154419 RepID=UPI0033259CDD